MRNLLLFICALILVASTTLSFRLYNKLEQQNEALQQTYTELQELKYQVSQMEAQTDTTYFCHN